MFHQRFSIATVVGSALLAWTLAAAPASADPRRGDVHSGYTGFRAGGFQNGYRGFRTGGFYGGYNRGYSGYRTPYSGYHLGYGSYHDGDRGLGYGRGYYSSFYRSGLGLGAWPYYTSSYYYASPSYYTAPYYSSYYDYTPPVVDYSPTYVVTPPAETTLTTVPAATTVVTAPAATTVVTPSTLPNAESVPQPTPDVTDTRSQVEVVLPSADAEVFFNGNLTRQKGVNREFASPPLTPGQVYHYNVEARWMENGHMVDEKRAVTVAAGQTVTVDFTR